MTARIGMGSKFSPAQWTSQVIELHHAYLTGRPQRLGRVGVRGPEVPYASSKIRFVTFVSTRSLMCHALRREARLGGLVGL